MKTYLRILLTLWLVIISSTAFSESFKDWQPYKDYLKLPKKYQSPKMDKMYKDSYEAEKIVRNLLSKTGGTVDMCLNKKADLPAVNDLGWNVYPLSDGAFKVERIMLLNNKMQLKYKWHVNKNGKAKAVNGKAIGITK